MSENFNPYAPPQSAIEEVLPEGCWRDGKHLVMPIGTALPHRCVKCNGDAVLPSKSRKFYWHHPGWYLLIVISVLVYAIVAMCIRKRVLAAPGLCAAHRARRRNFQIIAVIGLIASIAMIGAGAGSGGASSMFVTGFLLLLATIFVSIFGLRLMTPVRIDKEQARFRGCGKAFLDSLPGN